MESSTFFYKPPFTHNDLSLNSNESNPMLSNTASNSNSNLNNYWNNNSNNNSTNNHVGNDLTKPTTNQDTFISMYHNHPLVKSFYNNQNNQQIHIQNNSTNHNYHHIQPSNIQPLRNKNIINDSTSTINEFIEPIVDKQHHINIKSESDTISTHPNEDNDPLCINNIDNGSTNENDYQPIFETTLQLSSTNNSNSSTSTIVSDPSNSNTISNKIFDDNEYDDDDSSGYGSDNKSNHKSNTFSNSTSTTNMTSNSNEINRINNTEFNFTANTLVHEYFTLNDQQDDIKPMNINHNNNGNHSDSSSPINHHIHSDKKISKPKKERKSHTVIEKRYRSNINEKMVHLKEIVPTLRIAFKKEEGIPILEQDSIDLDGLQPARRLNKASILMKAIEYINHLENKCANFESSVHQ